MSKCEHGLTSKECFVCASPKYGKHDNKRENDLTEALNALGQIVTMADRAIGCSPSEQDDYLAKISDLARKVAIR